MTDTNGANWMNRIAWARCREPYRTELNTIGSHWVEGTLTDEALAVEVLTLLVELDWVEQPSTAHSKVNLTDVSKEAMTLANAMVMGRSTGAESVSDRRAALDTVLAEQREKEGPSI